MKSIYANTTCSIAAGVVITTNHKSDGIYLDDDDRRHFVAWSDCTKEDFDQDYWNRIYAYYDNDGVRGKLRSEDSARVVPAMPQHLRRTSPGMDAATRSGDQGHV